MSRLQSYNSPHQEFRQSHNPITNPIGFKIDVTNPYLIREYEHAKEKHLGDPNSLKVRNLAMVGNATLRHSWLYSFLYGLFLSPYCLSLVIPELIILFLYNYKKAAEWAWALFQVYSRKGIVSLLSYASKEDHFPCIWIPNLSTSTFLPGRDMLLGIIIIRLWRPASEGLLALL